MKKFDHVEDYLELIGGMRDVTTGNLSTAFYVSFTPIINLARYDTAVLTTMCETATSNKALTERQGDLAVKIVTKYKKQLAQKLIDVTPVEEYPKFRVPLRKMDYRKFLSISGDKLIAKFPYDTRLIEEIRSGKKICNGSCEFNIEIKSWEFGLTEYNLNWIHTLAKANGFEVDSEVTYLVDKIAEIEATPFAIELFVDNGTLDITNCPQSMRDYINDKLGGFGLDNLEKLADHAGELGFTIRENLLTALRNQYGPMFTKMIAIKEAKLPNITADTFAQIIEYAVKVNRAPVVIYEPNRSGALQALLYDSGVNGHYQIIENKKGKIDPDAQFIHTVHTINTMDYIPLLITTAGMIYGSDKQIMFQNAGKVLYLTPEVYRKSDQKPTVENLGI